MIRILHTADIHLGARLAKLGDKTEEQRVQIQKTFENIVDLAIEKKVDIFLIAGDLFDTNDPDQNLIDFALSCFARLNDRHIHTFVALGTHDFLSQSSILKTIDLTGLTYIHIFNDPSIAKIGIDDLSTVVLCNPLVSNKSGESPFQGIVRDELYSYNIAMGHGSVQIPGKSSSNDSPITIDDINATRVDYIALGHWHNQQQIPGTNVVTWYSGAPEMIDLDQSNSGKILLVTIDDNHVVSVESIQVGRRFFSTIEISSAMAKNAEDIITQIRTHADSNCICNVRIEGVYEGIIDGDEIKRRVGDQFFFLQILNNAQMAQIHVESDMEDNVLKMKFVENIKMMGKDEALTQEALQLGLMLIDGKTKVY